LKIDPQQTDISFLSCLLHTSRSAAPLLHPFLSCRVIDGQV